MEANAIRATTYGNEDVLCQSDFHQIIFWMSQVIQINYKNKNFVYKKRLTFAFTQLGMTVT